MPSNAFARVSSATKRPAAATGNVLNGVASLAGGCSGTLTSTIISGTALLTAAPGGVLTSEKVLAGQSKYTTPGTYSWKAPSGVTSVCVVCIGGGAGGLYNRYLINGVEAEEIVGGSGGQLAYKNNISVTPGATYVVVVGAGGLTCGSTSGQCTVDDVEGGDSSFGNFVRAKGGRRSGGSAAAGDVINNGGTGSSSGVQPLNFTNGRGGGGAGGYSGAGGNGGSSGNGSAGSGGGGGGGGGAAIGGRGGNGGGVGLLGQGSNGSGGTYGGGAGGPGSGGSAQTHGGGGGAGKSSRTAGGGGAVRIIWGPGRAFPSTNTGDA